MPVFPGRCFGLMPSSAIFGLSRQPQQRPLGFRDLLAQVLFGDDGLLQRFQLAVWPDVAGPWRNVGRWPDGAARARAVEIFQRLNTLGERHRMPVVANAAATSNYKKGRKFVFGVTSPAERFLEGLIDMAARRGLKTVAVIHEDTLLQRTIAEGTLELARKRGLQVVLAESYPRGTTDSAGSSGK